MAFSDKNQLQQSVPSHLVDKDVLSELFDVYLRRQNKEALNYLKSTLSKTEFQILRDGEH